MKKLKFISCSILCLGFVYSLCHAANDYGLRSNKLSNFVLAQSDETSTNGSITCDGLIVLCSSYMHREISNFNVVSSSEGSITIMGQTVVGLKKNTTYTVVLEHNSCRPHSDIRNMCDRRQQGTKIIYPTNGSETSGDHTN